MFWWRILSAVFVCASLESEGYPPVLQTLVTEDYQRLFDIDMTQREITLDLELDGPPPDFDFTQKVITEDYQRLFGIDKPPRGRPAAERRSYSKTTPKVWFPPGQPTPDNLLAICRYSNRRPRYPDSYFPESGFGYLRRQGATVNQVESWYRACCHGNGTEQLQEVTLCCARQAWEQSLFTYCSTEASIKTRQPECCKKNDGDSLSCFHKQAQNPTYMPIIEEKDSFPNPNPEPEPGFSFNPNICNMSQPGPRAVRENDPGNTPHAARIDSNINFPPGRPTPQNINLICIHFQHRPRYSLQCLLRTSYGWLASQSMALNRLERGFNLCCKGRDDDLACAGRKWQEVLDRFCEEEQKDGAHSPSCCGAGEGEPRYTCFSDLAPNTTYELVDYYLTTVSAPVPTLAGVCKTHGIIKTFPVSLQSLVGLCCSLPGNQKSPCIQKKLKWHALTWCSQRTSPADSQKCCFPSFQKRFKCLSGLLINAIAKATKSTRPRKCPLLIPPHPFILTF
ncbi:hypothetical protein DPEC_G00141950 [Dallia pectoralis]|uniref:Uncharacterized protein n=1 Tax=Dallia pectoralis TaxID=75939 RepID=A0ACC2GMS5_DALPE|nr:hypothetical protein DPEC_G00141950 [Dallia pectoralis]